VKPITEPTFTLEELPAHVDRHNLNQEVDSGTAMGNEVSQMSEISLSQIRRQDRAVEDDAWIMAMLRRAPYGSLATAIDGQPCVKPTLFVFDEAAHVIYTHGAREGRTAANLDANPRVCFSVSEMGRFLPGERAKGFALEYAGVVVFGKVSIIGGEEEARHGLELLLDKYAPHLHSGEDYQPMTSEEVNMTNVYRIDIEQWSGKKREADSDFPGAFHFGEFGATARRLS
jgi:nitroimidazol reductase NimA-like FMN-containing flavoprotein (pyridoxamine 5'-phosphate oxidase superfamily)